MTYKKQLIDRKGTHETRAGVEKPPLDDRSQILIQQATSVADFLRTNRITIVPSDTEDKKYFIFTFYKLASGKPEEIAEVVYNRESNICMGAEGTEVSRRLQTPGLVNTVIRPIARLLNNAKGDFFHSTFDSIHKALDEVEG